MAVHLTNIEESLRMCTATLLFLPAWESGRDLRLGGVCEKCGRKEGTKGVSDDESPVAGGGAYYPDEGQDDTAEDAPSFKLCLDPPSDQQPPKPK
ncbi:hypothetical protein TELCIR_03496 [Teladorsagia circumcincta]|uniref:Uncharacterized protein n=1 Tax=Teladorsagia circumcincta TaxID=45464 RepID=A0A2G9UYD1_TELCI|nr:hypothetical protein TELCIR_03496 [Teladorsagia circumcincta]